MKIFTPGVSTRQKHLLRRTFLVMKITAFLLLISILSVSAATNAQQITLKIRGASLQDVLTDISQQTGYDVFCSNDLLIKAKPVTIELKNTPLAEAMNTILAGQALTFKIDDKTIIIKEKETSVLDNLKEKVKELIANIDVRGRIIDESGLPVPGATVTVKGTSNVTATDVNGSFYLHNVDPNATIVITSIGFEKQELTAKADFGTIKMKVAESKLDEVQVIAYGTTTQRLTVGNVAKVSAEDIARQPVDNPLIALQGRVAGLYVNQTSGVPGSGITIHVQGQNSIINGNDPLYVIDGVPYVSETLTTTLPTGQSPLLGSGGNNGGGAGNPMNFINPADIENIEVLKDADATAIYGSRAANGAILITTKKGKAGATSITLNAQAGWGQATDKMALLNTQQYVQMRQQALGNDGIGTPAITDYDVNGTWDPTRYTDWQKVLIGGTAHYDDISASVSGGNTSIQYLVGATDHRETTVFPGDFSDQKTSLHFSLNNASENQRFKFQLTGSYLVDNNQLPASDPTATALALAPDAPSIYKADGDLNWQLLPSGANTWTNPFATLLYQKYQGKTNNLVANAVLSYNILPGITIKTNLGYTNMQTNEFTGISSPAFSPASQISLGANARFGYYSFNMINSWIIEPQAEYKHMLGKGALDVLLGSSIQQNNGNGVVFNGRGYNSDALLTDMLSAATLTTQSTVNYTYKYAGAFGRVNYNLSDKYIVDLTIRRDGSSRFGANNQFHDFWSAGGAWVFSEETFAKSKLPFLSFGKLRGSYGTTGSDQIGNYQYLNQYKSVAVSVPYQSAVGLASSGIPNPNLQWELTRKLQFGAELGFLKNRIYLNVDYVYNQSSNELLTNPLPIITGTSIILTNLPATVKNTEWELSLNTTNVKTMSFTWISNINLTVPENKLISYNAPYTGTSLPFNLVIGQPIGVTHVFHYLGVDPGTGQYEFSDIHGNPTTSPSSPSDKYVLLNTQFPKYYGGFENTFRYKAFQLDVLLQYVNKIAANTEFGTIFPGRSGFNQPVSVLNRWQKPGDDAPIQRYYSNGSLTTGYGNATTSDAYYSNASYVRLKNLSFSYQFPDKYIHHLGLQSVRLMIQGQNLLTFTKFQGLDPETGNTNLPPLKILTLGIQAGF